MPTNLRTPQPRTCTDEHKFTKHQGGCSIRVHPCLSVVAIVSVLFFSLSNAIAATASERLNAFFKDVQTLRADFDQVVTDPRGKTVQNAKGTFLMQRPNKFRWNYETPYEQIIVADGTRLWVYDKDLEQVTVKKLDEALGNTPALLLSGARPLEEKFRVNALADKNDGLQWLELVPKDTDTSFKSVRLAFGKQNLEIMELVDSFEQITRLSFSRIQRNANTKSEDFKFVPPKGVDVVGDS